MTVDPSVSDSPVIGPDRVSTVVQGILRSAQLKGWTDEALGEASGLKPRTIKSYRVDGKQPCLANALSLAGVLGKPAVNALLALIGYGGARPLDEHDEVKPMEVVATLLPHISSIAQAASDGRFDHAEMPGVRAAADQIIATMVPLSSAAKD